MYDLEHTNLDIPLIFLIQNLYKLFLHAYNLHQSHFPSLDDGKNLLF